MRNQSYRNIFLVGVFALTAVSGRANLVLTAAGVADGFSVSTFATGLPSNLAEGPFGLTVVANGAGGNNVLLSDYASSTLYVFNDIDGQNPATALTTHTAFQTANGFANLNGVAYGGNGFSFGSFNSTGTFTPLSISGLPQPLWGMAADSATGELIASTVSGGLIAINPTAHTFRTIAALSNVDGVSVSPDGQVVYADLELTGVVNAYNVHTGALLSTLPHPAGSYVPDGTAVISSSNNLNGFVVINDNLGNLYLVDPVQHSIVLIGSNANERGDYASPDFSNGTLLLDYSDQVARLSCGAGCSIGSVPAPSSVPEPSSLLLLGTGFAALIGRSFQRKA
jgi:hypothetical protein